MSESFKKENFKILSFFDNTSVQFWIPIDYKNTKIRKGEKLVQSDNLENKLDYNPPIVSVVLFGNFDVILTSNPENNLEPDGWT